MGNNPEDKKPKVPDTYDELFPEDKAGQEPQEQETPVILYPGPSHEQVIEKRDRAYKIWMVTFIFWLVGGMAALWGYALLTIPWLRLPLALIAAGCLYALGNASILLLKRNKRLQDAQSFGPPRPLTPEEEKKLDEQHKKMQQEFIKSHNEKIMTCFTNYCSLASRYDKKKAIECLNCRISNACVVATNTRMMGRFHRKLGEDDKWKGEEE